jgi:hypothetical protein
MVARISPAQVRYIKLGWHGHWEEECLEKGIARLGFWTGKTSRYRLCRDENWDGLNKIFRRKHNKGKATEFTNEVRQFFADPGTTLWITFHGDRLYWGFLQRGAPRRDDDGGSTWRPVLNGWQSEDARGMPLTKSRLPKDVTKLAGYPGTSCNCNAAATRYLIRRLNAELRANDGRELVEDLDGISKQRNVSATTRKSLVDARLGQGKFRIAVLESWGNCCAVTGSKTRDAIRASHIKPWRESSNGERLDPNNGLPLVASLDALFDAGLISFGSSGSLLVSPKLSSSERKIFAVGGTSLSKKPGEKTAEYLARHRKKYGFA